MQDSFTVLRVADVDFSRVVGFYNQHGKDLLSHGLSMPSVHRRKLLTGPSAAWLMLLDLSRPSEDDIVAAGLVYLGDTGTRCVANVEMILSRPDYRGRGLGRKLMDALHAWGILHHTERFLLTSRPERVAARALYMSMGYQLMEGSDRHFFYDPPRTHEDFVTAVSP